MYFKSKFADATFIKTDTTLVNVACISEIDVSEVDAEMIVVTMQNGTVHTVSGFPALELVWMLKPSALEGHPQIKWMRHKWVIHNLFGHPLMQLLAWCGLTQLAIKCHDVTVPKPIGTKTSMKE